jgi:hypothetical protein
MWNWSTSHNPKAVNVQGSESGQPGCAQYTQDSIDVIVAFNHRPFHDAENDDDDNDDSCRSRGQKFERSFDEAIHVTI